jgi:hypothetical protein
MHRVLSPETTECPLSERVGSISFLKGSPPKKLSKPYLWKKMNIHFVPFSKLVNGSIKDLTSYIKDEHSKVGGGEETTSW